ncbi:MAG: Lpg1974 family pore-forming outer membrane protein [Simkaniaceae bacterium]
MKKFLPLLFVFSLLSKELDDEKKGPQQIEPLTNEESEIDPCDCLFSFPTARPMVCNGNDIFITADFILWQLNEEGTSFSYRSAQDSLGNRMHRGKSYAPDYGLNPGYRLGLGIDLSKDEWDLFIQYTWLHSHGDKENVSEKDLSTSTLAPLWFIGNLLSPTSRLTFATGRFEHHLNVFDIELGRNFFVSPFLKIRPKVGLKGTWQDEDYHVSYQIQNGNSDQQYQLSMEQDFFGFGPRAGVDSAWQFTNNFSMVGKFALSGLWSFFDVSRRDTFEQERYYHICNKFHSVKSVLELYLGLRFEAWVHCNRYHLQIDAGYEQQNWMNQNQYVRLYEPSSHGDKIFHGLTLQFRLDF